MVVHAPLPLVLTSSINAALLHGAFFFCSPHSDREEGNDGSKIMFSENARSGFLRFFNLYDKS